jgi:hypothetical protein
LHQTKTYSSDVAVSWMNMQIRLMRTSTGIANVVFVRPYAYSGITLYETVVQGMPGYQTLQGQLTGLSGLPATSPGFAYHWPSAANAALAYINKSLFPATSNANKAAIDSLENALNAQYHGEADPATLSRSIDFGKAIAQRVFAWAQTDGYQHVNDPFTPPVGPGFWVPPTIPLPATSSPYWGSLRNLVTGSSQGAMAGPPTPYSEDPASAFYKMAKEVYDASQMLTPDQTAMALYWRDIPGVTTPGHYVNILKQVLEHDKPMLDKAAVAYALSGIVCYDASVTCWKSKYQYNLVRPITYIRNVLGHTTWAPLLATPAHPEYPSAHAFLSASVADVFTAVFGEDYHWTDHTYDYLGFAPRPFNSFRDFGVDAGNSRLYAGIHYQPSIDVGLTEGRKVASNILSRLQLLKD